MDKDSIILDDIIHQDFSMENIINKLENGNVASFQIWDTYNKPFFRLDDIIQLRKVEEYKKKNIILYKFEDKYYLRRILKIIVKKEKITITNGDNEEESHILKHKKYLISGDNENILHEIEEEQIIAKAIAIQRKKKYYSLSIRHYKPIYVFFKTHFLFLRFKGKVIDHDMQLNYETIKNALIATTKASKRDNRHKNKRDIKKDLTGFESPIDYQIRFHNGASKGENNNSKAI